MISNTSFKITLYDTLAYRFRTYIANENDISYPLAIPAKQILRKLGYDDNLFLLYEIFNSQINLIETVTNDIIKKNGFIYISKKIIQYPYPFNIKIVINLDQADNTKEKIYEARRFGETIKDVVKFFVKIEDLKEVAGKQWAIEKSDGTILPNNSPLVPEMNNQLKLSNLDNEFIPSDQLSKYCFVKELNGQEYAIYVPKQKYGNLTVRDVQLRLIRLYFKTFEINLPIITELSEQPRKLLPWEIFPIDSNKMFLVNTKNNKIESQKMIEKTQSRADNNRAQNNSKSEIKLRDNYFYEIHLTFENADVTAKEVLERLKGKEFNYLYQNSVLIQGGKILLPNEIVNKYMQNDLIVISLPSENNEEIEEDDGIDFITNGTFYREETEQKNPRQNNRQSINTYSSNPEPIFPAVNNEQTQPNATPQHQQLPTQNIYPVTEVQHNSQIEKLKKLSQKTTTIRPQQVTSNIKVINEAQTAHVPPTTTLMTPHHPPNLVSTVQNDNEFQKFVEEFYAFGVDQYTNYFIDFFENHKNEILY